MEELNRLAVRSIHFSRSSIRLSESVDTDISQIDIDRVKVLPVDRAKSARKMLCSDRSERIELSIDPGTWDPMAMDVGIAEPPG